MSAHDSVVQCLSLDEGCLQPTVVLSPTKDYQAENQWRTGVILFHHPANQDLPTYFIRRKSPSQAMEIADARFTEYGTLLHLEARRFVKRREVVSNRAVGIRPKFPKIPDSLARPNGRPLFW